MEPPEKKQKLEETIYNVLIPVDPIEVLKLFLPTLHFGCSTIDTSDSQVHKVLAIYRRAPFKAKHPDLEQARLKTAQKIMDAFIKNFFIGKNGVGVSGDLRGKLMPKNGNTTNSYIVGQQKVYSQKKQKEHLLYTLFQLDLSSIKISTKEIKKKRGSVWTGTGK